MSAPVKPAPLTGYEPLPTYLEGARRIAGLSLESLAAELGIPAGRLAGWARRGSRPRPGGDYQSLDRLCQRFEVDASTLLSPSAFVGGKLMTRKAIAERLQQPEHQGDSGQHHKEAAEE